MTGLTRHITAPVRASPVASSPTDAATRDRHAQSTSVPATSSSQASVLGLSGSSRATTPRSDWLETKASSPTRPVFHRALVQNSREASGNSAAASTVAAVAVPDAVTAARHRRVTSR